MRDRAIRAMLRGLLRIGMRGRVILHAGQRMLAPQLGAAGVRTLARGVLLAALALAVLTLGAADAADAAASANASALPAHGLSVAASSRLVALPLSGQPGAALDALDVSSHAKLPAICVPLPAGTRMWTPQQLVNPRVPGHAYDALGRVSRCEWDGLPAPEPAAGAPQQGGQVILVSLAQQWLWAYQDGRLVFANPITSGQPQLATPPGTYHVQAKVADTTFYSPWGPWSPYYYAPEHVNYALLFRTGGYFLHDAPWRAAFGPGTNAPHTSPGGARETGSHGCVNLTTAAAGWLYHWANVGAMVLIVG